MGEPSGQATRIDRTAQGRVRSRIADTDRAIVETYGWVDGTLAAGCRVELRAQRDRLYRRLNELELQDAE